MIKNILALGSAFLLKNRPVYVHYGITHRCNLQCRMCAVHQDAGGKELSPEEIAKIFEAFRRAGVIYVSIGGGEPFLREDLVRVVSLLRKKGLMVRLLTNGTLVREKTVRELAAAGLREVSVSLDTLDPRTQSHICNCQGVWEKAVESLGLFRSLLPRRGSLALINTVVSRLNIDELPALSRFAGEKGCYISFVPVEASEGSEFAFTPADHPRIDRSYARLLEMKRKGAHIFNSSLFLRNTAEYLKSGRRNWKCDAGKLYFSVDPRGEISFCHRLKAGLPSPRAGREESPLSSPAHGVRDAMVKECAGCMRPCWAEISMLSRDGRSFLEMAGIRLASLLS